MDGGYQLVDILLFAGIAAFLVIRLRSVLGRRTGFERRRDPFAPPPRPSTTQAGPPPRLGPMIDVTPQKVPPTGSVAAIKAADPTFDEAAFLSGARTAFQMIITAFAAGDKASLQPLLSKNVFEQFANAIDQRLAAHEVLQTTLDAIRSAEVVASSVEGRTALVTVKFVSDQTNVTRGSDGAVRDGDPQRGEEHIDSWTFARPLRSADPNWTLVATHSP